MTEKCQTSSSYVHPPSVHRFGLTGFECHDIPSVMVEDNGELRTINIFGDCHNLSAVRSDLRDAARVAPATTSARRRAVGESRPCRQAHNMKEGNLRIDDEEDDGEHGTGLEQECAIPGPIGNDGEKPCATCGCQNSVRMME